MNLTNYGIKNVDSLLKSILLVKLKSKEVLISYGCAVDNGIVLFLPMELLQFEESCSLNPWLPYVKERAFYIKFEEIQVIKSNLIDYVNDRYKNYTELIYKDDITEVIQFSKELEETEEIISINSDNIVLH